MHVNDKGIKIPCQSIIFYFIVWIVVITDRACLAYFHVCKPPSIDVRLMIVMFDMGNYEGLISNSRRQLVIPSWLDSTLMLILFYMGNYEGIKANW